MRKRKRMSAQEQQARKVAKKERQRKKRAAAKYENNASSDRKAPVQYAMCEKKRAYPSRTAAMLAAAHSHSGDMLRWYKCPYAPASKPHWHLTKTQINDELKKYHKQAKEANEIKAKEDTRPANDYSHCFIVKCIDENYPLFFFPSEDEAISWASQHQSFTPIEDTAETRTWLEDNKFAHYSFSEKGVLCTDFFEGTRMIVREAKRLWAEMEAGTAQLDSCYIEMSALRENLRRLGYEHLLPDDYAWFLEVEDKVRK